MQSNGKKKNGKVERFHSSIAEIFRCIKSRHDDLGIKDIFKLATSLYNSSIHTAHKRKPSAVFFALDDERVRSLDPEAMLQARDKMFDKVLLDLENYQRKTQAEHNKNREQEPKLTENEVVYVTRQGVKSKTQPKFIETKVKEDRGKTFIDSAGRKIHKENIKRIKT